MDPSPIALLEFETEVMDVLAAMGSHTAIDHLREHGRETRSDADFRIVEAMLWRVCVARSLGLVSGKFAARAQTAAAEITEGEPPMEAVSYLEENLSLEPDDDADELLRGFVSLDVEFIANPAVELLCICINTLGREPPRTYQDEITIVLAERFSGVAEPSGTNVNRLVRDFPEDMLCLAELARDVEAYIQPLAGNLTRIVNRRFRGLLTAAAHVSGMQLQSLEDDRIRVIEQPMTR